MGSVLHRYILGHWDQFPGLQKSGWFLFDVRMVFLTLRQMMAFRLIVLVHAHVHVPVHVNQHGSWASLPDMPVEQFQITSPFKFAAGVI